MVAEAPRLRDNHDFLVVLFGQGISSFGDSITNTAMPLLVLALTGSGLAMGVVGVLTTLPDLIVGLPAGAYADRWDRRRMMFGADLGRCVLTALVPISVWLGGPTLVVIFAVTFPMNVLRVLWLAAYTAAVPGLVGRAEVPRANAIFEAVFNTGWIVGPALAGFLAAAIGPGATIAIDALTFLISAGAMLLVRRPLRAEGRSLETHILTDIREGVAYVLGQPTLRACIALWTTTSVISTGLTTATIYYITIDRGLSSAVVGTVLSGFALGAMLGSVAAARLAFRATGLVMLAGAAVFGGCLLVIAVGVPVPVMIAAAFVAGAVNSNILVAYITMRTLGLARRPAGPRRGDGEDRLGGPDADRRAGGGGAPGPHRRRRDARADGRGARGHRPAVRLCSDGAHGTHPGADPCRVANERAGGRWEALRCAP